jgi:CDP-diacylglycerol--glycerol-3-phosphate 3-phosphatidyltransferase
MLVRSAGVRALRQCARSRKPYVSRTAIRKFSTPSPAAADAPNAGAHPLAGVASEFDRVAPRFEIEPSHIDILSSPSEFYDTVKTKIKAAKRRVYLSTLYIGKTEHELIATINEALEDNPDLEVSILTDALRGTRESPDASCASLLAPLITKHGSRVKIAMFHTPNLKGWKKKYIPKRLNEGWGLQHMKLYGFDDEIMLSGANLSADYFTNRLDRYHLFSSKELTVYYAKIHDAVCELSYDLQPAPELPEGYVLESPINRGIPDPVWHTKRFKIYAKQLLEPLIHKKARQKMFPVPFTGEKTFVYPVAQFDALLGNPINIGLLDYEFQTFTSTEKPMLSKLLTTLAEDQALRNPTWTFTAGYFNIDPEISELLLAAAPASSQITPNEKSGGKPCTVITASPWANGFYGSSGISGLLPAAYTLLSRRFLREVSRADKTPSIQLKEWRRGTVGTPGGWTYHAKGLWATLGPNKDGVEEEGPSVTLVGSSNYTKRSYSLDLEVGAMVVTADPTLKKKLKDETEWLQRDTTVTTMDDLRKVDRRVGFKVRAAMWLVEKLGGAL